MAATKISRALRTGRALAALSTWDAMAKGPYASNTLRAWKAGWNLFLSFRASHLLQSLKRFVLR